MTATATIQKQTEVRRRKQLPFSPWVLLVIAWIAGVLGPYFWTFITSITPQNELGKGLSLWPDEATFDAYRQLLTETSFLRFLMNSFVVAAGTVLLTTTFALLAGTALSRYEFRGRRIVLFGVLVVQLFPAVLLVVPLYSELRALGLLDSLLGLILVHTTFALPFSTWLMKGFVDQIPKELEEAAYMDGASRLQSFIHVILPLSKSGIAAAGTYAFIYSWNEFIYALTFTTSDAARTIPVGLRLFIGENTIRWEFLTAGGILAAVPIIIGFMFAQKSLVAGLTAGAVKG
jgi:ABC-type sugar transport system, permease component